MSEVYYKGHPYQYKVIEYKGKRQFHLYKNGALKFTVEQCELDVRSIINFILDAYYRNTESDIKPRLSR